MTDKLRYMRYPVAASERPRFMHTYYVTGWGEFPYDMLRYDSAWPGDSEAASRMAYPGRYSNEQRRANRSVKLHSYREPTIGRWASFLWSVGTEDLNEKKVIEPFKDAGDLV